MDFFRICKTSGRAKAQLDRGTSGAVARGLRNMAMTHGLGRTCRMQRGKLLG